MVYIFMGNLFIFIPRGPVTYIAVHPSGRLALTASKDRTIRFNLLLIILLLLFY